TTSLEQQLIAGKPGHSFVIDQMFIRGDDNFRTIIGYSFSSQRLPVPLRCDLMKFLQHFPDQFQTRVSPGMVTCWVEVLRDEPLPHVFVTTGRKPPKDLLLQFLCQFVSCLHSAVAPRPGAVILPIPFA